MTLTLRQRLVYLREVFSSVRLSLFALACAFIFGLVIFSLSNMDFISTNMGDGAANLHSLVMVILSMLFGINVALLYSRALISSSSQKKEIGTTSIASALGILFAGCATCGLTLASYIGLGSFAAFLPWNGIEINLIAIVLLLYSIWNLSTPVVCTVQKYKRTQSD